jgi:nucleotide-binding universal stress UspA family protein
MRILLATDGSSYSVAAAQSIADRPWPHGTEIRVIGVAEVTPQIVNPAYIHPDLTESPVDDRIRQAQMAVSSAEQTIKAAHLTSSTTVAVGVASEAILNEADAWDANRIVVGSHGRHGLDRLLIGSVSESVAIHAMCSVEVIRGGTAQN